jgi:ParB family chromosome partitioning protein
VNNEKKILELNLGDILPNRFQPRIKFSEESINQLSESIKEHGVIQPIVVRRIGDKYEIIAGERRYKASVLAGKTAIPAIITDLNDKDSAEVALIENVQRQDLTPIEEAISYKKILDMGYTQEQLANKLGNKQSTIANKLRLLNLNEEVQEALLDGKISERHARSVLRLSNSKQQSEMLNNIIAKRLTVRKTDEEIDKILNSSTPIVEEEVELFDANVFSSQITENSNVNKGVEGMIEENKELGNESSNINLPVIESIEPKKNESSMEIFNIKPIDSIKLPSQPIIDNIMEEKLENSSLGSIPVESKEEVNPGFLNIDKIENEAKDIFEEKPLADVNSLLEADPSVPVETKDLDEDNENPEKLLIPGKFFDILNEEQEDEVDNISEKFAPNVIKQDNANEETKVEFEPFMNPIIIDNSKIEENKNNNLQPEMSVSPFIEEKKEEKKSVVISPNPESIPTTEKKLKTVIDIIRDCSKNIESTGYSVEVEEIDFEDNYQVIFKIIK